MRPDRHLRWILLAAAVMALVPIVAMATSASAQRTSAPLGRGASVPPRAVTALDMFSAHLGVGVVEWPPTMGQRTGRYYLARTNDGGVSWRVSGSLPATASPAPPTEVEMAFASATTGYVTALDPSRLAFTTDGGRSWSTVRIPGHVTAMIMQGRSLWVTSQRCPSPSSNPSLCPTSLAAYVVGQPTPTTTETIPTEGPITTGAVHSEAFEATVWTRRGDEALASEGQQGLPASILQTIDAGRSWTLVDNPCGDLGVTGLVQSGLAQWYLYCSLDGGMHQGTNQLWATTDSGAHWKLNGEGAVQGPALGNIGSVMSDDLTASGNGDVLWMLGSVDGIGYSTDGGHQWGGVGLQTGGYPAAIATAGGTEAWLPLPTVGLYRTLDGTRWTRLS